MRLVTLLISLAVAASVGACQEPPVPKPQQEAVTQRDLGIPEPRVQTAQTDDVGASDRLTRDELACRETPGDRAEACLRAADAYERGRGASVNHARAQELLRAACRVGHHEACTRLSTALVKGRPDLRTSEEAVELARKPCDDGFAMACYALGTIVHRGLVPAEEAGAGTALELFERGCEGGYAKSCDMLGRLHFAGGGGAPKDARLAVDYYRRACKLGAELSCQKAEMPVLRQVR